MIYFIVTHLVTYPINASFRETYPIKHQCDESDIQLCCLCDDDLSPVGADGHHKEQLDLINNSKALSIIILL